mgnify:CR=1 FL=1
MNFTYKSFIELINLLKVMNYQFTNYKEYKKVNKPVIFRHDIDNSLEKALEIARIEHDNKIKSTYLFCYQQISIIYFQKNQMQY